LIAGPYEIVVSHSGFKTIHKTVEARISDRLRLDFALEIGDVNEKITVTAEAEPINTENGNVGAVIDSRRVADLPTQTGNPTLLLMIAPGFTPTTPDSAFTVQEPGCGMCPRGSFYGAPGYSETYTLSGVNNVVDITRQYPNSLPPTDAVQEFKISHTYDASIGASAGTSVDVSLKSGTNALHGGATGTYRSDLLGANDFFANRSGGQKTKTMYKEVVGNLNGPVYIPGLYNGKNRTFFMYAYDNVHEGNGQQLGIQTVPTPAELTGDFSKLLSVGSQYQIYDPLSTTATSGGFYSRTAFPGNIIPQSRIDPIAKNIAPYWPQPNLPGGADGSQNFQPTGTTPTNWWQSFVRIDHNFNERHRLFGQWGYVRTEDLYNDVFHNITSGTYENYPRQTAGLDYVYVARTSLLFDFRYGFSRWFEVNGNKTGFDGWKSLGFSNDLLTQIDLTTRLFPAISVSGYSGLGGTGLTRTVPSSHTALAQVDYLRGSHAFKFGLDFRKYPYDQASIGAKNPSFSFGTTYTNGPLNTSAAAPEGQGLAAFLLGRTTGGSVSVIDSYASMRSYYGAFIQDDWRVTPRLTVNLGFRYEYYGAPTERYNRSVRGFDFNATNPLEAPAVAAYANNPNSPFAVLPANQFHVRGGLLFAGAGGQPSQMYNVPSLLFAPRVGFAYRIGSKSVFRGGYGLFFIPPLGMPSASQEGFSKSTSIVPSLDNGLTYTSSFADPFPQGLQQPLRASGGLLTDVGLGTSPFNPDGVRAPYVQRWSATVEHTLPLNTLLEVSYIGTRSTKLLTSRNLDYLPANYLSTLPYRDTSTINALSYAYPNPFQGLLPGTSLNGSTIALSQLLLPYPEFTGITTQTFQGYSWYHAMEIKLEKRFGTGLGIMFHHVWSKNMDATSFLNASDPVPTRVISSNDRPHTSNLSAVWDLPFGKSRAFGKNLPPGILQVVSGWSFAEQWTLMSGSPIQFGSDVFFNGDIKAITLPSDQRTVDRWFNTSAGFVLNAAQQPSYHLRTFPLRLNNVRTDGINFWDMSLMKDVLSREREKLLLKVDFFNAFNHPNFSDVNVSPSSSTFGAVTAETTFPRRIQAGLKLTF